MHIPVGGWYKYMIVVNLGLVACRKFIVVERKLGSVTPYKFQLLCVVVMAT